MEQNKEEFFTKLADIMEEHNVSFELCSCSDPYAYVEVMFEGSSRFHTFLDNHSNATPKSVRTIIFNNREQND